MNTPYHRLGDYIREVNIRNSELKVTNLLGLSVSKEFMPSIANTIGTDMSAYKVVNRGQLVYIADTSRRGDKIAIALLDKYETAIVSQAYTVFEITDKEQLLPEYLMMWFRRPEFDRYARFHSHGSAREVFDWDELCNVMLPVPTLSRQRELVAEYETLTRRIRLNEQMIAKLEETAQALYRKMFVDGVDKERLPEGWRMGKLGEIAILKAGGDKPSDFSEIKTQIYNIPVYANGIENKGIFGYTTNPVIKSKSITISARGTIGYCFLRKRPYVPIVRLIVVIPKDETLVQYIYFQLNNSNIKGSGSVQSQLTVPDMEGQKIILPSHKLLEEFNDKVEIIDEAIEIREQEIEKLKELLSLLLTKLGKE
ncbi:MAG: restriction endonuclease subunit S [Bacteroidales bacterium]|nr:restriction endonuclease subunit S [Bacteroidales bacterium]